MKPASVSVVIPCFNCARSLERAVLSVASQSRKPAELILIDDASSDETPRKLEELTERYGENWIKVIQLKRNHGPATARNVGWDQAKERFIAFLDADDAWHPKKIEIQYHWMSGHPDVLLTGHHCLTLDEESMAPPLPRTWRSEPIGPRRLLVSNRFPTRSVMLRRDIPFRFRYDKRYSEDYLLWLKLALNGHSLYCLGLPLGYVFKAPFGEEGLTADLWNMEKGELDTYRSLREQGLLSPILFTCATLVSFAKFIRRLLISHRPPGF